MKRTMVLSLLLVHFSPIAIMPKSSGQEPTLADVLKSTPDRANSLLYMDVPTVREFTKGSPIASDLSDKIGEVRIASNLDLRVLEPNWEIGYISLKGLSDPEGVAKSIGGYVDTIQGKSAIWSPRQSYLIPMQNNLLGIVRPADRKLAGRWLKKEKNPSVAEFLAKQAEQATKFLALMLAVDLEDSLSKMAIKQRIETFESLKGTNLDSIATTLATVKGLKVLISRKNLDDCIISLEFGTSPSSLLPVAKEFFVEVLERNNSSIPEATNWKPSIEGNTLSFRGTISAETIDDLLGVFTLQQQASSVSDREGMPVEVSTSDSAKLEASKNFFAKASNVLTRVRDYTAHNTGDRAQWNGKMARRIDELPTLNVDPELVDYAARVAQGLRGNMVALQQTNISYSASATANNAGSVGYYGGSYGGYYSSGSYYNDANEPYRYRKMAQAQGNSAYKALIAEIDQQEADIRRKMTEKYKVQF